MQRGLHDGRGEGSSDRLRILPRLFRMRDGVPCGPWARSRGAGDQGDELGPWKTRDGSWQYDFVPIPTDWCDLCEERTDRGSRPACARRCRYGAITYGTVDELAALFKGKSKMLLFSPKSSDRR